MRVFVSGLLVAMFTMVPLPVVGQEPKVVEAAAPGYPQLPSGGRESGEVKVEVTIAKSGTVVSAKAMSGPDRLRAAAEGAARQWRFSQQDDATAKRIITFGFNLRAGLGEPPPVVAVFKGQDRIDVFAEERKLVVISDPALEDVDKARKKRKKQ